MLDPGRVTSQSKDPLLQGPGPWRVKAEPWKLAVSCQNREEYLFGGDLQEHRYLTVVCLKNKGFSTKKSATTNHASPSPFLEKVLLKAFREFGLFKA